MKKSGTVLKNSSGRRLFLQNGMIAAGAATMGSGLLPGRFGCSSGADRRRQQARQEGGHRYPPIPAGIGNGRGGFVAAVFGAGRNPRQRSIGAR